MFKVLIKAGGATTLINLKSDALSPPSFLAVQLKLLLVSKDACGIFHLETVTLWMTCPFRRHWYVTLEGLPGSTTVHSKVTSAFLITVVGSYRNLAGDGGSTKEITLMSLKLTERLKHYSKLPILSDPTQDLCQLHFLLGRCNCLQSFPPLWLNLRCSDLFRRKGHQGFRLLILYSCIQEARPLAHHRETNAPRSGNW